MPTVTFKYDGATISVREGIGRDEFDRNLPFWDMLRYIAEQEGASLNDDLPDHLQSRGLDVIKIILRSTVEGELGIPINGNVSDYENNHAVYDALMDAPVNLIRLWRNALSNSDLEIPDPND